MPYGFLDGFQEIGTHSGTHNGCHASTFGSERDTVDHPSILFSFFIPDHPRNLKIMFALWKTREEEKGCRSTMALLYSARTHRFRLDRVAFHHFFVGLWDYWLLFNYYFFGVGFVEFYNLIVFAKYYSNLEGERREKEDINLFIKVCFEK